MTHEKLHIFAEPSALERLCKNPNFINGIFLKAIIKQMSEIFLIMDEFDFAKEWTNSESPLRKFFEAYDIQKPQIYPNITQIYSNPEMFYKLDPFAIWLLNRPEDDINKIKELMGVWAVNTAEIKDDYFLMDFPKGYEKNDIIDGSRSNGWGNYLENIKKPIPPFNSIVLNDRFLIMDNDEKKAWNQIHSGLKNLKNLLNELLPQNLVIPFHILIYCQHPKMSNEATDMVIDEYVDEIKKLRKYNIEIEFVYARAQHKRGLYSNYFRFYVDRAFNAFYDDNQKKLSGENDFDIISYLNNPLTSGDNEYKKSRQIIDRIHKQCDDFFASNANKAKSSQKISRVYPSEESILDNRLFSNF